MRKMLPEHAKNTKYTIFIVGMSTFQFPQTPFIKSIICDLQHFPIICVYNFLIVWINYMFKFTMNTVSLVLLFAKGLDPCLKVLHLLFSKPDYYIKHSHQFFIIITVTNLLMCFVVHWSVVHSAQFQF